MLSGLGANPDPLSGNYDSTITQAQSEQEERTLYGRVVQGERPMASIAAQAAAQQHRS